MSMIAVMMILHLSVYANGENVERSDSVRLLELAMRLEEMKLNELLLKSRLEEYSHHEHEDSVKKEQTLRQIDSLRAVTPGAPVIVENDTLFRIYSARGGQSAIDRAEAASEIITKLSKRAIRRDSVYLLDNESYFDIMCGDKVILSVTERDALWHGQSMRSLAEKREKIISDKITELRDRNSLWQIMKRTAVFIAVIFVQWLIVKLVIYLFRRLRRWIMSMMRHKMKPVVVHDYELLDVPHIGRILIGLSKILRFLVLFLFFIITIPILFSIFPQTEHLAYQIFNYILDPVKMVGKAVLDYIPNLFIIAVIWICTRYIVRGLRYIANEIKNEKLKIAGFYPDWAEPTFNIIRFFLYAFMIAVIYPYLPGSESRVFQGISVFVGVIVSLGSSTVISNFIAGFVITYMRPFKKGDFVKVNDTVGNVIEKSPFVTRVRTIKNEMVTIPNSFIISSNTVNYTTSANQYGLIIHTMLTMGYDVPWRKVHGLLIDAALATKGVLEHPAPFVLETELNDNYMCYQINAYIKDADDMPVIMSDMLQNIQDYFNEAGIELFAPHHFTTRKYSPAPIDNLAPSQSVKVGVSPLNDILGTKF